MPNAITSDLAYRTFSAPLLHDLLRYCSDDLKVSCKSAHIYDFQFVNSINQSDSRHKYLDNTSTVDVLSRYLCHQRWQLVSVDQRSVCLLDLNKAWRGFNYRVCRTRLMHAHALRLISLTGRKVQKCGSTKHRKGPQGKSTAVMFGC